MTLVKESDIPINIRTDQNMCEGGTIDCICENRFDHEFWGVDFSINMGTPENPPLILKITVGGEVLDDEWLSFIDNCMNPKESVDSEGSLEPILYHLVKDVDSTCSPTCITLNEQPFMEGMLSIFYQHNGLLEKNHIIISSEIDDSIVDIKIPVSRFRSSLLKLKKYILSAVSDLRLKREVYLSLSVDSYQQIKTILDIIEYSHFDLDKPVILIEDITHELANFKFRGKMNDFKSWLKQQAGCQMNSSCVLKLPLNAPLPILKTLDYASFIEWLNQIQKIPKFEHIDTVIFLGELYKHLEISIDILFEKLNYHTHVYDPLPHPLMLFVLILEHYETKYKTVEEFLKVFPNMLMKLAKK